MRNDLEMWMWKSEVAQIRESTQSQSHVPHHNLSFS